MARMFLGLLLIVAMMGATGGVTAGGEPAYEGRFLFGTYAHAGNDEVDQGLMASTECSNSMAFMAIGGCVFIVAPKASWRISATDAEGNPIWFRYYVDADGPILQRARCAEGSAFGSVEVSGTEACQHLIIYGQLGVQNGWIRAA